MKIPAEECKISVIIATRNRAEALEKISLPALAKQTFKDFEVIVWDASDNADSSEVVKRFPELNIRYFKAPRVGSCSQRNDAVKVAGGDIIYFIDDDSEPSPEALKAIFEAMQDETISACSPPIAYSQQSEPSGIIKFLSRLINKVFFLTELGKRRVIKKSGRIVIPKTDTPQPAEWLHGGSMACRSEVFDKFYFDEELEYFMKYAVAEDIMFTYSLHKSGKKIEILEIGNVIHYGNPMSKEEDSNFHAATIYNFYLIWRKLIFPYDKSAIFPFGLSLLGSLLKGLIVYLYKRQPHRLKGYIVGIKKIFRKRG